MNLSLPRILMISACLPVGCSRPADSISFSIVNQSVPSDVLFVSIAIENNQNVWLSGTRSTFVRTTDGGRHWQTFRHPKVDTFQFRDIHVFDAHHIALLAAGKGAHSQIHLFSTRKGWQTAFVMDREEGFLNSMAFWDEKRGLAYGDAIDEKPYILKTEDGGLSWHRMTGEGLPDATEGEGGFASSGSCIEVGIGGTAWIGTGAGDSPRILKTTDYGESWTSYDTPLVSGALAGITSVHFRDASNGLIAGGDLSNKEGYTRNLAFTSDGGERWTLTNRPVTQGAFYGSDFIRFKRKDVAIACGPNGADISFDRGKLWSSITDQELWVVDLHPTGVGWLAGRDGTILKIQFN